MRVHSRAHSASPGQCSPVPRLSVACSVFVSMVSLHEPGSSPRQEGAEIAGSWDSERSRCSVGIAQGVACSVEAARARLEYSLTRCRMRSERGKVFTDETACGSPRRCWLSWVEARNSSALLIHCHHCTAERVQTTADPRQATRPTSNSASQLVLLLLPSSR